MITYQDYLEIEDTDKARADFVKRVIGDYTGSEAYKTAKNADDYDRCKNTTITQYQKVITLVTGAVVPDKWSATHRSASNFFNIFTTQLNQYLLGNGVHWENEPPERLGDDFDLKLQRLGKYALCGGVSYGFYNLDHVVVFSAMEFAPIKDEETSELRMGVRFWQVDSKKPLRATFYTEDGYTNYMWTGKTASDAWEQVEEGVYMQPQRAYTYTTTGDAKDREDGTEEIVEGDPVPGLPIFPMYANPHRQSELVGLREKIDAYDFILNGFEDDLDNAQLYWIISGAGGMDDVDLQQFFERLKTVRGAAPADGQTVTPVTVEIPVAARETLLERLTRQLYRDAMIMNPEDIASGAVTATQIRAAYERQNVKADQFEYCVLEFLQKLMKFVGIEDEPTFTRSTIVNTQEEIQTVVSAAQYLSEDYVVGKILTLLGDGDKTEEVLAQRAEAELAAINTQPEDEPDEETTA